MRRSSIRVEPTKYLHLLYHLQGFWTAVPWGSTHHEIIAFTYTYIHTQTHYNHRNDGTVRARTSNCVRLLLAAATPLIPACLSVPPGLPLPADTITAGTFEKRRRSTQETSCCFEALRAAMAYVCMVTRWSPIRVQLQAYSILPLKVHKN